MSKVATMEFKRGDGCTHYAQIPLSAWTSGGKLMFVAKTQPDNDPTDAAAVIPKTFTDSSIVGSGDPNYDPSYATYRLDFVAADTNGIQFSSGTDNIEYEGEFQFVPVAGQPISFPGDNNYINVIVYADLKRGVI